MSRIFLNLAAALAMLASASLMPGATRAQSAAPVVVELFTSQGCNTCPPADAFLGELAKRPNIVALGFHVDYWDYIGWKDPFASPAWTERQRAYKRTLGRHMVYTPQMVIDGRIDAVGSHRTTVNQAIAEAARAEKVAVAIVRETDDRYRVALPEAKANLPGLPATVWVAVFDHGHETQVKRGENAGATLRDFNIVRELRALGEWSGGAAEFPLELDASGMAGKGCAILVQSTGGGPILGAALLADASGG